MARVRKRHLYQEIWQEGNLGKQARWNDFTRISDWDCFCWKWIYCPGFICRFPAWREALFESFLFNILMRCYCLVALLWCHSFALLLLFLSSSILVTIFISLVISHELSTSTTRWFEQRRRRWRSSQQFPLWSSWSQQWTIESALDIILRFIFETEK